MNIHRIVRRGFIYGPMLPEGVMEDDGVDRGIVFLWMGAYLDRQFEFVKSQWHNDGNFVGLADEKDLIAGANDGSGTFTIPSALHTQALAGRTPVCEHEGVSTASSPASGRCTGWLSSIHEAKGSTTMPQREVPGNGENGKGHALRNGHSGHTEDPPHSVEGIRASRGWPPLQQD